VGIFDPDRDLQKKYASKYGFADACFFTDVETMLVQTRPEAVAIFTADGGPRAHGGSLRQNHIDAMMEKPLAVSWWKRGASRGRRGERIQ